MTSLKETRTESIQGLLLSRPINEMMCFIHYVYSKFYSYRDRGPTNRNSAYSSYSLDLHDSS